LGVTSLFAAVALGPLLLAAGPPAGRVDVLIDGGTLVTMDERLRVIEGGALALRGGVIEAVLEPRAARPAAREVIDARGQLVIPGLVNAHGHVPMALFRGLADDLPLMDWLEKVIFPAEARAVDREFCYWGTLLACLEMARSGTTTFADMYYFEDEIARATERAGLRAVLGQTVIGFPAPDHATPDDALRAAEAFILRYKDHPRIVPSVAPHALYTTSLEVARRARELSRRHGVPFQMHARESPSEDAIVTGRLGRTAVAALEEAGVLGPGVLLHHLVTATDDDIRLLARLGAGASHNPESNMKVAAGVARVPEMLGAGLALGLGTDGAASNNNLDLFEEMDTAAKLHKLTRGDPTLLPAREVFRLATLGGARALGLDRRIGSLEAGKQADVVLVDVSAPERQPLYDVYSQLVYAVKGAAVRTVLVDGRVIVRDGRVLTLDEDEILARAQAQKQRILKALEAPAAR
jgi:5-methylthioadenosine/S-adenosylhomocysteine deaminase